ncbi:helix-turn-helix domain-containing protein [Phycicoccus sp. BSK3Z-2]|uniref:Helix-turn-helix domain-containing protein n=1 Tax=Phycicoccus avicenniae TaxID=2828860 RepID=A0A941I1L9_9MICO|nr:helix-turn-helix domain-containing protein [Phycicoccus avicenniae]MBR7744441.1 helix-turn-helix domain-containing protein [Phycicoccus avicenniae]
MNNSQKAERDDVEPYFLTIRAAAKRFSVSYDFVHDAILDGDLPAKRPSREWLVKPEDVVDLIDRRTERRLQG